MLNPLLLELNVCTDLPRLVGDAYEQIYLYEVWHFEHHTVHFILTPTQNFWHQTINDLKFRPTVKSEALQ